MGRTLALVESLAAALLLVTLVTAWTIRKRTILGRRGLPIVVVLIVAIPSVLTVYGMWFLNGIGTVSMTALVAWVIWTLAFLIGSLIIAISAKRPDAAPWSIRSLALAFAAAAILTAITMSNLDVAVKGQLAAVRVEASAKAMALAPPRLPDSQNAAIVYRKAFAVLVPHDRLADHLGEQTGHWQTDDSKAFDPTNKELAAFLDSQQRGLALLREAAAQPQAAFDRDLSSDTSPVDILLPELPHLRHGATLLALSARVRAARGDAKGAIDDVIAIFGIARHINYPLLIDLMTATAIERIGVKVLEDVLTIAPSKPDELAKLTANPGESFREHLRRTILMEEAWGMAAITMIATGRAGTSPDIAATTGMDKFGEAILVSPIYRVFFLEEDLASYRRHMRTMRENVARPGPAMLDGFEQHEQVIKATRGGGILAGLLLPGAWKAAYAALDGDALRGLVRVATAIAAFKAKRGKYPEKLEELVPDFLPAVPPDPYDGRPLRMMRAGDGIVLYSVGRDRKDDGGQPEDDKKKSGDLVFRLR